MDPLFEMWAPMKDSPVIYLSQPATAQDTEIYSTLAGIFQPVDLPLPLTLGINGVTTETVMITAVSPLDDELTVTRGVIGPATAWPAGTLCARVFTSLDLDHIQANILTLEAGINEDSGNLQEEIDNLGSTFWRRDTLSPVVKNIAVYTSLPPNPTDGKVQVISYTAFNTSGSQLSSSAQLLPVTADQQGIVTPSMKAAWDGAVTGLASEVTRAQDAESDIYTMLSDEILSRQQAIGQQVPRAWSSTLMTDLSIMPSETTIFLGPSILDTSTGNINTIYASLPLASDTAAGLMSKEDKSALEEVVADIQGLQESGGKWLGSFTTKAALDAFTLPGNAAAGDIATVEEDETQGGATTQYRLIGEPLAWQFDMIKTIAPVATATNSSKGIVQGQDSAGKVYVESDGTMSLVGYDALASGVSTNASAITSLGESTTTALAGKADASELTSHIENSVAHITAAERTAWNAKLSGFTAVTSGALLGVSTLDQLTARLNAIFSGSYAIGGINVS